MKVFVTGADGMLGTCVCIELLKRNVDVTAMVLNPKRESTISRLPIKIVEGNVLNLKSIKAGMQGADFVIHIAASTLVWPRKNKNVVDVNLIGTMNVANVAQEYGVKRMVHIGSASSFANGSCDKKGNEDQLVEITNGTLDYISSKLNAQKWLNEQHKNYGFPVIILCPTFMIGPYDSLPSSGKILQSFFNNQLPAYSKGGKNFVNTEDVAIAVVNALNMGKLGESYILGNENLSFEAFLKLAAKTTGKRFKLFQAPSILTLSIGFYQSVIARITQNAPLLSFSMAQNAIIQQNYSANKAVRELQLPQRPLELGINNCYKWFKENGKIK